jgi:hypothetical protein
MKTFLKNTEINKLSTFYNYKFLDVDVRLFFYAFLLEQAIKNNRILSNNLGYREQIETRRKNGRRKERNWGRNYT